jgi:hypothetical protein
MAAGIDRYLKATRNKPAKKLPDGTQIIASSTVHGPKQSRCMRCKGMCRPARMPGGQEVLRCDSCGVSHTLKTM